MQALLLAGDGVCVGVVSGVSAPPHGQRASSEPPQNVLVFGWWTLWKPLPLAHRMSPNTYLCV